MKVRIGHVGHEGTYTVEDTPTGLRYEGQIEGMPPGNIQRLVESMRKPGMSDANLLRDIPRALNNGYFWSQDTAREPAISQ